MKLINKYCWAFYRRWPFQIFLMSQFIYSCFSGCKTENQNYNSIVNNDFLARTEMQLGLNCDSKLNRKEKKEIRIWLFTGKTYHQQLLIIPFNGRYQNYLYNSSFGFEHDERNFIIDSIRMESAIVDSTSWHTLNWLLKDTSSLIASTKEFGIFPWDCIIEIFEGKSYKSYAIMYRGYFKDFYINKEQKNLFDFLKNKFNFPNDQSLMY